MRITTLAALTCLLSLPSLADPIDEQGGPWPRLARMPNRCEAKKMTYGDPMSTASSAPFSMNWEDDVDLATPRGIFTLTRTFVGDRRALGQTDETDLNRLCRDPVVGQRQPGLVKAPFGRNHVSDAVLADGGVRSDSHLSLLSLTSVVDVRCPSFTRVLTPDGDTRFFARIDLSATGNFVPRSNLARAEPSRLRLVSGNQFMWLAEDGRRAVYQEFAGPQVGQYRLVALYGADGSLLFEVDYAMPSTSAVPGQNGLDAAGQPARKSDGTFKPYTDLQSAECSCRGGLACDEGACRPYCFDPSSTLCRQGRSAVCAHTADDPRNCGACGRQCAATEYCARGACLPQPAACDAALEPVRVRFPETDMSLRLVYRNPSSLFVGTPARELTVSECVLDRIELQTPSRAEVLVRYEYALFEEAERSGFAQVALSRTIRTPTGGANSWTLTQPTDRGDGVWSRGLTAVRAFEPADYVRSTEYSFGHTRSSASPRITEGSPGAQRVSTLESQKVEVGQACADDAYSWTVREFGGSSTGVGKLVQMTYLGKTPGRSDERSVYGPRVSKIDVLACTIGTLTTSRFACARGYEQWFYAPTGADGLGRPTQRCVNQSPEVLSAYRDRVGAFTRWQTSFNENTQSFETASVAQGATSEAATDSLVSARHTYQYRGLVQEIASTSTPSALSLGAERVVSYQRAPDGFISGVVTSGETEEAGRVRRKHIGIFYRRGTRPCSAATEAFDSERVTAVEGPCEVDSPQATQCNITAVSGGGVTVQVPHRVTEYFYYGSPGFSPPEAPTAFFNSGRVASAVSYAGACASGLTTLFARYSSLGYPGEVTTPDGQKTLSRYDGELLTERTLPTGARYVFEYDRGRLSRVTRPEGDSTVYCTQAQGLSPSDPRCFRSTAWGTGGFWIGGIGGSFWENEQVPNVGSPFALSRDIAWVADVAPPPGLRTVRYELRQHDKGALSQRVLVGAAPGADGASFGDPVSILQHRVTRDGESRPAVSSVGNPSSNPSAGVYSSVRFDSESRLAAVGAGVDFATSALPSNAGQIPPFCQLASGDDPRCTYFARDRLGRLTGTAWRRDSVEDCIAYDRQENISVISLGCPNSTTASVCGANHLTSTDGFAVFGGPTCGQRAEYIWDDFGRLVSMRRRVGGAWATTSWQHAPSGAVVTEENEEQRAAGEAVWWERDALERVTSTFRARGGQRLTMTNTVWDSAPPIPAGCAYGIPSQRNTAGRVAYREDPVWRTWLAYDANGRVVTEKRVARAGGDCTQQPALYQHQSGYSYRPNGGVEEMQYPFGRRVRYQFPVGGVGDNNLPSGISVELFPQGFGAGVGSVMADVISQVEWTGDRRLKRYVVTNFATPTVANERSRVELTYGGPTMTQQPAWCFADEAGVDDRTGRLRRIRVTNERTGAPLYERTYTWMADQISAVDVCYEGQLAPLNLVKVPFGGVNQRKGLLRNDATGLGGEAFRSAQRFELDAQSNRTAEWSDAQGGGWRSTLADGSLLTDVTPTTPGTKGALHYRFDAEGRQVERTSDLAERGIPSHRMSTRFPTSELQASGGLDSVLRTMQLEQLDETNGTVGLIYNYFYDGQNHRIRKTYPTGGADDFFYGPSNELLAERSFEYFDEGVGPQIRYALDEYVYLGGMPVLAIVGAINRDNQIHLADLTGTCTRRNVARVCQLVQVVPDIQGTPVVAFDGALRVTGVGEYDVFGHRNRIKLLGAETAHPFTGPQVMVNDLTRTQAGGLEVSIRGRASFRDARISGSQLSLSYVELRDAAGTPRGTSVGVYPNNWTPWVKGGAPYSLVFEPTLARVGFGAASDAFEFERTSVGVSDAVRYFPPLRFPGQYFDEESELHENWNRFYDPGDGRYLSPEPLLQDPGVLKAMARHGRGMPTYAYAMNNPIRYSDPDGKFVWFAIPFAVKVGAAFLVGAGIGFGASQLTPRPVLVPNPVPTAGPNPMPQPPGGPPKWPQCSDDDEPEKNECEKEYDACMDAAIEKNYPNVGDCVECKRTCGLSGGKWPWLKIKNGAYQCDYTNPFTPSDDEINGH